jgi:GGDEF domain-containing protein
VALPDTAPEEAHVVAERLRRAVGTRPFTIDCEGAELLGTWGGPSRTSLADAKPAPSFCKLPVTVSIGVAAFPSMAAKVPLDLDALLRRADAALY